MDPQNAPAGKAWLKAIWSGAAYLVLVVLSRWLSDWSGSYIPFWLPAALFIARLLTVPTREWAALVIVLNAVNLTADFFDGMPVALSVALACANSAEAIAAAILFRRLVAPTTHLATLREYLWLILTSAIVATGIGAFIGAGALVAAGFSPSYWAAWRVWWINNGTAVMVLAPILLAWGSPALRADKWWRIRGRIVEMLVLCVGLLLSLGYLFRYDHGIASPNKLLPIPFLLWSALRFNLKVASGTFLAFALAVTFLTLHSQPSLSTDAVSSYSSFDLLHIYLTVCALVSLIPVIALNERNDLTRRLEESEERFRVLGDASNEGIIISENGRVVDGNNQALRLFGYDWKEFTSLTLSQLAAPSEQARLELAVQQETETPYPLLGLRKDGSTFPSEARPKMTRLGDRRIRITAVQDLTEQKRTESILRDNELRFRRLIEGSPEAIIIHKAGVIVFANPAAVKMHGGRAAGELIGRKMMDFVHPDFHGVTLERRKAIIQDAADVPMVEMRFLRIDGSPIEVELQSVGVEYEGSSCIQITARDVTERRNSQILSNRLAAIVEYSDDCIISKDTNSIVTSWNRGAQKVFGYTAEEMIGRSILKIIPEDRREEESMILSRIIRGESVEHFETVRRRKDGGLIDVSVTASPIRDSSGRVIGASKVARDITSRKRIENALRLSEDSLRTAQRLAHLGSWTWDIASDEIHWSDEMYRLNGLVPGSPTPIYMELRQIYSADSWERLGAAVKAAVEEAIPYSMEVEVIHPNGTRRWHSVFGEADRDATGHVYALHGGALDITQRKNFEIKLLIGDQALRSISQGVLIAGQNRRMISVNPAFTSITGYSETEILGNTCRMLHGPLTETAAVERIRLCLEQGDEFSGEITNYRKDGSVFTNELTISPIKDERGRVTHFVGVSRDVSERKKATEERLKLELQLRQSQKLEAVGTLASGIAHDFNNILAGIYGFTGLAREAAGENAELAGYLNEIGLASKRAADLVRQILTFSRTRHDEDSVEPVHLEAIVGEVTTLLRAAGPRTIDFVKTIEPGLPPIHGNVSQLHQVVMNLGTNALQAMGSDPGQLTIRVESVAIDEELSTLLQDVPIGPAIRLTVSDTGCGMDPRTLERAFEPFFTTKAPGEGTGLGLSVVHGIVRSHRGGLRVRSEVGHGTSFEVFLPVTFKAERSTPSDVTSIPRGSGERILFVDDEERIARSSKLVLNQLGYNAEADTQVLSALARVKRDPTYFRLVISDQTMPYMTGLEFAARVRMANPDIPVLLTSGHSAALTPSALATAGVSGLLSKPFTVEMLASVVSRTLHPPA